MNDKRDIRFFNTTGPCDPYYHYMLPPEDRLVGAQLHRYIKDRLYWALHAPRQTGKTTFLLSWMREINAKGEAVACYVSVETCQGRRSGTNQKLSRQTCSRRSRLVSDFRPSSRSPSKNLGRTYLS